MKSFFKSWKARILLVLAVVGPGFITANVDNDAGGIFVYSQAGAQFGYTLLWTMIPITIALIVVQEMCARLGAVTGKGLSDLIREEFGFRLTFIVMLTLVVTNYGNIVAEFAGIASSLQLFGWSKYVVVPVCALLVWVLVVRGTYASIEKVFLTASAFYVCYIVAGVLAHPDWKAAFFATVTRPEAAGIRNYGYLFTVVGLIGTTIAPWMQFYLQASIVEKGVTAKQYRASRWDVILGCIFTDVVAWFIIVACAATLYAVGKNDIGTSGADAAVALRPLAGDYAYLLFAFGLFNASFFAASILPISTAYAVCEGLGFESGLDKKFHEAPVFYWLYTVLIVVGAGALLIPRIPLVYVSVLSQVANGAVLPFVLIFMLLLTNDKELMGEHTNSRAFNVIAWTTVVVVIVTTLAMFVDRRQSKESPGRSSMTSTPAGLTRSRSRAGVPVSSGNVPKCIGTTALTPSHSHAFAACSGPIV
jgi:Mn2+/Fe2+ NRAMP family transporter